MSRKKNGRKAFVGATPKLEAHDVLHAKRYAYVTLLCDEENAAGVYAAGFSLNQVRKSDHSDMVVIHDKNISQWTRQNLATIGFKTYIVEEPVPYPFKLTFSRLQMHKECRYNKLLLWTLVEYEKVVYFDTDMLFLQNTDQLFKLPELSAAPDSHPPDKFNSGIFVAEPKMRTFRRMIDNLHLPSYNVGDQGFLNEFFSNWFHDSTSRHLPYTFNAFTREQGFMFWDDAFTRSVKVLHFSGEPKPWQTFRDRPVGAAGVVGQEEHSFNDLWHSVYADVKTELFCSRNISTSLAENQNKNPQLTLVVSNFRLESPHFHFNILYYCNLNIFHSIILLCGLSCPNFSNVACSQKIRVVKTGRKTLTDRFGIYASIETTGVLIMDDDILIDEASLRAGYHYWVQNQHRIVGYFPRHFSGTGENITYLTNPKDEYSIILTKGMFVSLSNLQYFMCNLDLVVKYVNKQHNCEDIALNVAVATKTGVPPMHVLANIKYDSGTTSGISNNSSHINLRQQCIRDLMDLFHVSTLVTEAQSIGINQGHNKFTKDSFHKIVPQ